jgi:hypothetical protein
MMKIYIYTYLNMWVYESNHRGPDLTSHNAHVHRPLLGAAVLPRGRGLLGLVFSLSLRAPRLRFGGPAEVRRKRGEKHRATTIRTLLTYTTPSNTNMPRPIDVPKHQKHTHTNSMNITFAKGRPYTPLMQLLNVLPSQSGPFLPESYRDLMVRSSPFP